jgi:hypothetical protein
MMCLVGFAAYRNDTVVGVQVGRELDSGQSDGPRHRRHKFGEWFTRAYACACVYACVRADVGVICVCLRVCVRARVRVGVRNVCVLYLRSRASLWEFGVGWCSLDGTMLF